MSNDIVFERIKRSDAYLNRNSRDLPSTRSTWGSTVLLGGIGVWCLMVLSFTIFFMSFSVVCAILPALMFCLGVMMWVKCFRAEVEFKDAAVEANPAIVISKHSRSSGDMSSHHITFEFEDGERKEYRIGYANEAALIGVGDAGVAFTKQSVFLAFDRVT